MAKVLLYKGLPLVEAEQRQGGNRKMVGHQGCLDLAPGNGGTDRWRVRL